VSQDEAATAKLILLTHAGSNTADFLQLKGDRIQPITA
jgi:hypothetical protein